MEGLALAAVLLLLIVAERLPRVRFEPSNVLRRHVGTDLVYLATGAVGLGLAMRRAGVELAAAGGTLVPGVGALPPPLLALLATVLYDLGGYGSHLALHRSGRLWRFHKVHHSSRLLDWLAAFRAHVVEHALRHLISTVLLLLLGVPVWAVATAAAIYTAWAALGHANLRVDLRFLEPLFITPRLHRLHHVPATSTRNLGTIFSLWDRLRGSLVTEAPPGPLGVPGEIESYPQTWLHQLVEPLRDAQSRARTSLAARSPDSTAPSM